MADACPYRLWWCERTRSLIARATPHHDMLVFASLCLPSDRSAGFPSRRCAAFHCVSIIFTCLSMSLSGFNVVALLCSSLLFFVEVSLVLLCFAIASFAPCASNRVLLRRSCFPNTLRLAMFFARFVSVRDRSPPSATAGTCLRRLDERNRARSAPATQGGWTRTFEQVIQQLRLEAYLKHSLSLVLAGGSG